MPPAKAAAQAIRAVDQLDGQLAETSDRPVPVEFRGSTYDLPTLLDWPKEALLANEDGRLIPTVLRKLLTPEQHAQLDADTDTIGDVVAFFNAAQAALGVAEGKSGRSSS